MLDRKIFEREIVLLELRFGQELANQVKDDYFDILKNDYRLTTEEFQFACRQFRKESHKFPIPKEFELAVRPDGDELAIVEWQAIAEFLQTPPDRRENLVLSSEGEQAYKALGGRNLADRDMTEYRLIRDFQTMRRAFAKKAKVNNFQSLPSASTPQPKAIAPQAQKTIGSTADGTKPMLPAIEPSW